MNLNKRISVVFIAFLMIFLSSCNNKSEDTKTNADLVPEKITLGMYSSASYNPLDTTTIYNEQAFFLMYDSLFNITEDFQAEKNLASDVSIDSTAASAATPSTCIHCTSAIDTATGIAATALCANVRSARTKAAFAHFIQ